MPDPKESAMSRYSSRYTPKNIDDAADAYDLVRILEDATTAAQRLEIERVELVADLEAAQADAERAKMLVCGAMTEQGIRAIEDGRDYSRILYVGIVGTGGAIVDLERIRATNSILLKVRTPAVELEPEAVIDLLDSDPDAG